MNAQIKIFDENGYLYSAENVQLIDLEMEIGSTEIANWMGGTERVPTGHKTISLTGRIVDYIDRSRKLNRKVLIV